MAKKILFAVVTAVLLLAILMTGPGCVNSASWDQEQVQLLSRATSLNQRHCRLKASIDSLWDVTTVQLERALPASFPAVDRDIYLKARNADHIRMFMSFDKLDAGTKTLVSAAGQYDAVLAKQIHILSEQIRAFEQEKNQFLRKVESHDTTASRNYADEFRIVATELCQ